MRPRSSSLTHTIRVHARRAAPTNMVASRIQAHILLTVKRIPAAGTEELKLDRPRVRLVVVGVPLPRYCLLREAYIQTLQGICSRCACRGVTVAAAAVRGEDGAHFEVCGEFIVSVVDVMELVRRREPTLLLLQYVPAVCVPDTACRCGSVGYLGQWCRVAGPVVPQSSLHKCHRCKEKVNDGLHLSGDVRVFWWKLEESRLVWSYGLNWGWKILEHDVLRSYSPRSPA